MAVGVPVSANVEEDVILRLFQSHSGVKQMKLKVVFLVTILLSSQVQILYDC